MLQAIGNLTQEMDQKEDYMRCMSGLVQKNLGRLKDFVQQLVQVDQKEGTIMAKASMKGHLSQFQTAQIHHLDNNF